MGNVKALILKNGSSFFPLIQSPKGNEKKRTLVNRNTK